MPELNIPLFANSFSSSSCHILPQCLLISCLIFFMCCKAYIFCQPIKILSSFYLDLRKNVAGGMCGRLSIAFIFLSLIDTFLHYTVSVLCTVACSIDLLVRPLSQTFLFYINALAVLCVPTFYYK